MAQPNRNAESPHLPQTQSQPPPQQQPNGSTATMSNASQQQDGQARQGYPSPTSYPSPNPTAAPQYNYPPPQQQEPYRASPTGSNTSMNQGPSNVRALDPHQQQQQQQQQQHQQQAAGQPHQHQMGSPHPPPVPQMGGGAPYYNGGQSQNQNQNQPQYPNVTSDPMGQNGQNMRYALPVGDARIMSGGRHKKEIKRRTKTGCLTCRKRRIKCDEQHPNCRNCIKSKRDCLGYDPIFKQQPGPAAIQPAPSSSSSHPPTPNQNPYGNQPQMLQGAYGVPNMNYDPSLAGHNGSPAPGAPFDYASAIDPALESAPAPGGGVNNHFGSAQPVKRSVEDLLALGGAPPPPLPQSADVTQSPPMIDESKHLYFSIYGPGLENFIESRWFRDLGCAKLLTDKALLEQFATLLQQFNNTTDATDAVSMHYTASVEARVVWSLACMVRSSAADLSGIKPEAKSLLPPDDDPVEASHRLTVFENLLTGKVAEGNPLTSPVPGSADHHRLRELEFWYTLGNFVCLREDDPNLVKEIDDTLSALRNLLDGRENRDVIYSIAIIRAIGQRVAEYGDGEAPYHLDEGDNRNKLLVAKRFVQDEAHGAGTTNVIRRLCELATRTWSSPVPAMPK